MDFRRNTSIFHFCGEKSDLQDVSWEAKRLTGGGLLQETLAWQLP
jgi:hypothetical protein